ncbi:hypothetical protein AS4_39310 [Acinetobacter guillouiae]|nr:hypothetical protein AS4_39310 [Acinetobacter guillouiae]
MGSRNGEHKQSGVDAVLYAAYTKEVRSNTCYKENAVVVGLFHKAGKGKDFVRIYGEVDW